MNDVPRRQTMAPRDQLAPPKPDGFVRFLKQHASPPHHRVTAGGRIVPAGPHSPPPMFDYESLTGMLDRRRHDPRDGLPPQVNLIRENNRGPWQMTPDSTMDDRTRLLNGYHRNPLSLQGTQEDFLPNVPQSYAQTLPISGYIPPVSLIPVGAFEDGSVIASCNGNLYRTFWNGSGTVIEPLSTTSPTLPAEPQANLLSSLIRKQEQPRFTMPSQTDSQVLPLSNATNQSRVPSSETQIPRSTQQLEAQQRKLEAELHDLDRRMALHHYELTHEQRKSCVSQRRTLIQLIDNIRKTKEPSSQDQPFIKVKDLAKRASERASKARSGQQSSLVESKLKSTVTTKPSVHQTIKALSPNAPPFIPSSVKQTVLKDAPKSTPARDEPIPVTEAHQLRRASGSERTSEVLSHKQESSLDRDPTDPAMRIVHNSDVAYAATYEDELIGGRKRYCTTVSEFQEALRRVRQQARFHGCAGGSSKDPAYDAEQDIWWAICDKDPIPLPTETPDHVVNPRPWDWNNSAFNYRSLVNVRDSKTFNAKDGPQVHLPTHAFVTPRSKEMPRGQSKGDEPDSRKTSFRRRHEERGIPAPGEPDSLLYELGKFADLNGGTFDMGDFARIGLELYHKSKKAQTNLQKSVSESNGHASKFKEDSSIPVKSKDLQLHEAAVQTSEAFRTPQRSATNSNSQVTVNKPPATDPQDAVPPHCQCHTPSRQAPTSSSIVSPAAHPVKSSQQPTTAPKEKAKRPSRTKSKQSLKNTNSLRRHRHALKELRPDKQTPPPPAKSTEVPPILSSDTTLKPQPDGSSDTSRPSLLSRTGSQLSPRAAARKALQLYDRSRSKSPL